MSYRGVVTTPGFEPGPRGGYWWSAPSPTLPGTVGSPRPCRLCRIPSAPSWSATPFVPNHTTDAGGSTVSSSSRSPKLWNPFCLVLYETNPNTRTHRYKPQLSDGHHINLVDTVITWVPRSRNSSASCLPTSWRRSWTPARNGTSSRWAARSGGTPRGPSRCPRTVTGPSICILAGGDALPPGRWFMTRSGTPGSASMFSLNDLYRSRFLPGPVQIYSPASRRVPRSSRGLLTTGMSNSLTDDASL